MPNVTMLSWNIRNFGPGQVNGHNAPHLFNYIARTILSANAEIISIMEVANSVSIQIATGIINSLNAMGGVMPSPWRFQGINNGFNEAYLMIFRVDRTFLPLNSTGGITTGPNVTPDNGLTNQDIHGDNTVQFPRPGQRRGGRKPFYCAFRTTAAPQKTFTVFAYHAMFGIYSGVGVENIPKLDRIDFLDNAPTNTVVDGCLIAGDFNVDYDPSPTWWYYDILTDLPSTNATAEKTTLKTGGDGSSNPLAYRSMAYDNIFQKIPAGGTARPGTVIDLMVHSSVLLAPIPPLPAYVGTLSAAAGAFSVAHIPNKYAFDAVATVPTPNVQEAWAFVIEAISNHYPVAVTTTF